MNAVELHARPAATARRPRGQLLETWSQAWQLRRTKVGALIVGALVLVAVVGPFVAPYSPNQFVGLPFAPPGGGSILGTDALGRDVFSRVLCGGRSVIGLAAVATLIGVTLGSVLGIGAAYVRGLTDAVVMRAIDVALAFPQVVFVLLLLSGVGPHTWLLVLAVAVTHAPRVARVVHGVAVGLVDRDFVLAAEAMGEKRRRIVWSVLLPNVSSAVLVEAGLRMTYSIGLLAGISFLGFGLQPPTADWGLMINENRIGIAQQPWGVAAPVILIALLTIGTNLITDGVARAALGIGRKRR